MAQRIQIYGVWHCGDDLCTWGSVRSIAEFDEENHWIIDAYRSQLPFDPIGQNHTAELTLDFAAGDRWLIDLTTKATTDRLGSENPVLYYANAMVTPRRLNSAQCGGLSPRFRAILRNASYRTLRKRS